MNMYNIFIQFVLLLSSAFVTNVLNNCSYSNYDIFLYM